MLISQILLIKVESYFFTWVSINQINPKEFKSFRFNYKNIFIGMFIIFSYINIRIIYMKWYYKSGKLASTVNYVDGVEQ